MGVGNSYRVYTERKSRSIAGLSMEGTHTLSITIPDLEDYAYIGVFCSGIFELCGQVEDENQAPGYPVQHKEILTDNP